MKASKTPQERFWEKVDRTGGPYACWPWLASKSKYGPGMFNVDGKSVHARRLAYEWEYGSIQAGWEIIANAECKFACVNPAHLSALTKSESSRRKKKPQTTEELFWEKVDRTGGLDACWSWTRGNNRYGTGAFNLNGKSTPARRVAYELAFGPIQEGLEIRAYPECKFACVNPAHLRALTKSEGCRLSGRPQQTHCNNGHPFTEENTAYRQEVRYCIICRIDWHETEIARLSEGPKPDPENSPPDREPVYPELWGDRQRVIGGVVVDEKLERRFWKKADRTEDSKLCWIWRGMSDPNGYGLFYIYSSKSNRKITQAHIVAYQLEVGPIPEGLVIDHFRCGNKPCCNPAHLEPVTLAENTRRARKRKPYCGRGHPHNEENSYFTADGRRSCRACRYLAHIEMLKRRKLGSPPRKLSKEERFWREVDQSDGPTSCWLWQGRSKDPKGYGMYNGKRAHRLAWELANGRPIPEGLTIDHLCRNKPCCNPNHLEPVSSGENSRRAAPFMPPRGKPIEDRFWKQADTSGGPNACWEWSGESTNLHDSENEKSVDARHFIYQLKVGPLPRGKWILDRCGNPKCVNYRHLKRAQGTTAQYAGKPVPGREQLAFNI